MNDKYNNPILTDSTDPIKLTLTNKGKSWSSPRPLVTGRSRRLLNRQDTKIECKNHLKVVFKEIEM